MFTYIYILYLIKLYLLDTLWDYFSEYIWLERRATIVQKVICIWGLKNTVSTIPWIITPHIERNPILAKITEFVFFDFRIYLAPSITIENKKHKKNI